MMQTAVMDVTPDMAHKWLANNGNNRKLRKSYVKRLASAMERGEWELNGESIKIGANGELLDGQHRLNAVISAMVPIKTVVVTGLGDVFGSIDTGASRKASDLLGIKGEKQAMLLSAICRMVYQAKNNNYSISPTNKEVLKTLESNPGIRDSMAYVSSYTHFKGISQTTLAFLHYAGTHTDRNKIKEIEEFIGKVLTGENCAKGDPALTVRNRLIRAANDGGARMDETKVWLWKALIAYLNGFVLNRIKVGSEEKLPSWDYMVDILEMAGERD